MTHPLRLGLLRLMDAAPVIAGQCYGIFAEHGLDVSLSVEPSWANIADKLGYGLLDGAVMLPPLAIACAAGLRGRRTPLAIPLGLSANGNAVTLAAALEAEFAHPARATPAAAARALARVAGALGRRLRIAVVHAYSTHNLLLRYWLAAGGADPLASVDITVLPPAEMVGSLAAGAIDGFCAGAPWGDVAVHAGLGFVLLRSGAIWQDHPEKCLALRTSFIEQAPEAARALTRALLEAGGGCAKHGVRHALAPLLADAAFLDLPAPIIAASLRPETGGPVFGAGPGYPWPAHGAWFARQMIRWGEPERVLDAAAALYRPDLYAAAGGPEPAPRTERFYDRKDEHIVV